MLWLVFSGGGYEHEDNIEERVHFLQYPLDPDVAARLDVQACCKTFLQNLEATAGGFEQPKWDDLYPPENVSILTLMALLIHLPPNGRKDSLQRFFSQRSITGTLYREYLSRVENQKLSRRFGSEDFQKFRDIKFDPRQAQDILEELRRIFDRRSDPKLDLVGEDIPPALKKWRTQLINTRHDYIRRDLLPMLGPGSKRSHTEGAIEAWELDIKSTVEYISDEARKVLSPRILLERYCADSTLLTQLDLTAWEMPAPDRASLKSTVASLKEATVEVDAAFQALKKVPTPKALEAAKAATNKLLMSLTAVPKFPVML